MTVIVKTCDCNAFVWQQKRITLPKTIFRRKKNLNQICCETHEMLEKSKDIKITSTSLLTCSKVFAKSELRNSILYRSKLYTIVNADLVYLGFEGKLLKSKNYLSWKSCKQLLFSPHPHQFHACIMQLD